MDWRVVAPPSLDYTADQDSAATLSPCALPIPARVLLFVRIALAALWTFEGLWLKVIVRDPHELRIVEPAAKQFGLPGASTMVAIGILETALAALVVSGFRARQVAWVQGVILLSMNLLGIMLGGGEIRDPISLLVHNLPTFACIAVIATCGPGRWRGKGNG